MQTNEEKHNKTCQQKSDEYRFHSEAIMNLEMLESHHSTVISLIGSQLFSRGQYFFFCINYG